MLVHLRYMLALLLPMIRPCSEELYSWRPYAYPLVSIIIHFRDQTPDGCLAAPKPGVARSDMEPNSANPPPQVLCSLLRRLISGTAN
jgi:hypothetical protein